MFGAKPASGEIAAPANPVAKSSAMEMMLKNMGLGEVLQAAKELASSGSVAKIIGFSEGLDLLNARLERIETSLGLLTEEIRRERTDASGIQRADNEPGPDTGGDGSPVRTRGRKSAPEKSGAD